MARPWLPDAVRLRSDKAEFSHLAQRELRELGGREFFAGCAPVRHGWIDAEEICRRYDEFAATSSLPPHGVALVAVASVHHLLDALESAAVEISS
jgi:hypothetical protein